MFTLLYKNLKPYFLILACLFLVGCSQQNYSIRTIENILALPEDQINIAKTKLIIDKLIDPTINIDSYLNQIDVLITKIQTHDNKSPVNLKKNTHRSISNRGI